jgi:hypothetical protein
VVVVELEALIAAQYAVPEVSPVRLTQTSWDVPSLYGSACANVELAGVPLVPLELHHVELDGA